MLTKFGMENCAPASTTMVIGCNLRKHNESLDANKIMHRSMISGLIYLTTSRLDILQVVGLLARFLSEQKKTHMQVAKRIFRCLKGTVDFGL